MSAIDDLVTAAVRCCKCGAGYGCCDCWEKCSCGWLAEKGKPCRNPKTTRCSTKVKYGQTKRAGSSATRRQRLK